MIALTQEGDVTVLRLASVVITLRVLRRHLRALKFSEADADKLIVATATGRIA